MNVKDAVAARRSVRAFLDKPVEAKLLQDMATRAARAPSGGNLQPWHVDILLGNSLAEFRAVIQKRLELGGAEQHSYAIYPPELKPPYRDRRFAIGEMMYYHIGILREDKVARRAWLNRNYQLFGAPAALFMTVDRQMGPPQWSDLGMYLQTFMLLAVEEGLATCPQEIWAVYPETVTTFLGTPPHRMLFCGMAIGYEDTDHPANRLRTDRAQAGEWLVLRA